MSDNTPQAYQDDQEQGDVFQRRLGRESPTVDAALGAAGPPMYTAFALAMEGREEEGLTFFHPDGAITVKFYVHLTDIICPARHLLTLVYMDGVYILEGRNLEELIPYIKRHKLDTVHCFDPAEYALPLKGPVIYSIVRESHAEMAEILNGSGRA